MELITNKRGPVPIGAATARPSMTTASKFCSVIGVGRGFCVRFASAAPPPGSAKVNFPRSDENYPVTESDGAEGSQIGYPEGTATGWRSSSGRRRPRRWVEIY